METWKTWKELGSFTKGMFEFITKAFAMLYVKKMMKSFNNPDGVINKMAETLQKHSGHSIEECREQARLCFERNVRECEEFLRRKK